MTVGRYDISGATVERICRGAGASRGLIAHYFDSKEELLLAAAAETFDTQAMAIKSKIALIPDLTAETKLKRMAKSSFQEPIFSRDAILNMPQKLH
ncbi:MAG: TetR family transcriptional regulator [Pseudomonadota bacterium]